MLVTVRPNTIDKETNENIQFYYLLYTICQMLIRHSTLTKFFRIGSLQNSDVFSLLVFS